MLAKLFFKKTVYGKSIYYGLSFSATVFFIFLISSQNALAAGNSNNNYKGETIKNTQFISLKAGETASYTVKIKNTGTKTWEKSKVFLETGPFLKTASRVTHSSWPNFYTLAVLTKNIKPKETAQFDFKLQGHDITNGTIQENYQLIVDDKAIDGTLVRFFIDVVPAAVAKNTAIASPLPIVTPNAQSFVRISNLISMTTNQAVSTAIATATENIKKTADFCIALSDDKKTEYIECNTDANETDGTSGDVKYQKALAAEPIIRVGLYSVTTAQRVTCNQIYDVYAGKEVVISGVSAGYDTTISFDYAKKQYAVSTPSLTKFTSAQIRFVPRNPDGVIRLLDFKNSPKWNANYNDNQFRNIIEFRYSEKTGKLWAINELPVNNYLKGLAETTNYSSVEFQKVLITAARTYVMYHYARGLDNGLTESSTKHASEYFHVDATYDQVYKGYGSEIRMPKLAQAVKETSGLIVTYNNNLAITPYFSNSDGRTRSWTEVWGGEAKPWLVSVPVDEDKGQDLFGHGVGLSARGALLMISDGGKTWQETLKYFYQGTELQKMY